MQLWLSAAMAAASALAVACAPNAPRGPADARLGSPALVEAGRVPVAWSSAPPLDDLDPARTAANDERARLDREPECTALDVPRAGSRVLRLLGSEPPELVAEADAPLPLEGELYAAVDDRGYLGLLRAGAPSPAFTACYDGPCPSLFGALWREPPTRAEEGSAHAVGPVATGPRKARRTFPAAGDAQDETIGLVGEAGAGAVPPVNGWQLEVAFDLDGDGRDDLEKRWRPCGCEHAVAELRVRRGDAWYASFRRLAGGFSWCGRPAP